MITLLKKYLPIITIVSLLAAQSAQALTFKEIYEAQTGLPYIESKVLGLTNTTGNVTVASSVPPRPSGGYGGKVGTYPGETMVVDGLARTYRLVVPTNLSASTSVPLLVAFHGAYDNSDLMSSYSQLDKLAQEQGFILIYPNAQNFAWPLTLDIDKNEMDFYDALYAFVGTNYNIDLNRVFLTGMSNGAYFTHVVASQRSTQIAGVGGHSGGLGSIDEYVNSGLLTIAYKYGVILIHGTADTVVPISESQYASSTYTSWGHAVSFVPVEGMNHVWAMPLNLNTLNEQMWSFFMDHPMNVAPAADTAPPVISNLSVSAIATSTAIVSWITDEPATSYVDYGQSTSYGLTAGDSSLATNHSVALSGLSSASTYHFKVSSSDAAGNNASSLDYSFTTAVDPNLSQAPANINNLAVSQPTRISMGLKWTAPGSSGSSGTAQSYDIRYSTSPITESNWSTATQVTGEPTPALAGTNQSYTIVGLSQGTTYYAAIKTTNSQGLTSSLSNVVNFITKTKGK